MIEKELKKTGREGESLLKQKTKKQITTKNNLTLITAKINDKIQERVKEYIQEGIKNGYNILLFHIENGDLTKKPNWFGMNASNYQANIHDLLVALSKKTYGYGVLVGKQLKDFHLVVIDVDIDTEECKERISKELEELLNKHGVRYYKEITKNKRIHYKIGDLSIILCLD